MDGRVPPEAYDTVPSTFDVAHDEISAVHLLKSRSWETVAEHVKNFTPTTVINMLPPYLQLQSRLHSALRPLGVPYTALTSAQFSAVETLAKMLPSPGIITTLRDVPKLANAMTEKTLSVRYVQVVLTLSEKPNISHPFFFYEIHLLPGLPILWQCPALAAEGQNEFHPDTSYEWSFDVDATSLKDTTIPPYFSTRRLSKTFRVKKMPCVCGAGNRVSSL